MKGGIMNDTGLIVGRDKTAVLLNPESAFVIKCQCKYGCAPSFYVADGCFHFDVEQATIYRTFEAAENAKPHCRKLATGCMAEPGVTYDTVPLSGFIK